MSLQLVQVAFNGLSLFKHLHFLCQSFLLPWMDSFDSPGAAGAFAGVIYVQTRARLEDQASDQTECTALPCSKINMGSYSDQPASSLISLPPSTLFLSQIAQPE